MIQVFNNVTTQASPAEAVKTLAETGQAIATIVALIVGGAWTYTLFVRKRQRFPRATLSHTVAIRNITPGFLLVHLVVRVQNIGEVLLELRDSDIQLRQIVPLDEKQAKEIAEGKDPVKTGDSEVDWPGIGRRECDWKERPTEIEPGEYDEFHYDFLIDSSVTTFSAYSYFGNITKKGKEIGWNCATLHDTNKIEGDAKDAESQRR